MIVGKHIRIYFIQFEVFHTCHMSFEAPKADMQLGERE